MTLRARHLTPDPSALLVILALLFAHNITIAQTPNLSIAIEPDSAFTGVPRSYAVFLTNTTDHILRLPRPYLQCSAIPLGTVALRFSAKPLRPTSAFDRSRGCVADFFHSENSILQQISSWETLLPGQCLILRATLDGVMDLPSAFPPGTYTISAYYTPPYITPSERADLTLRRIDIPTSRLSSSVLTYTVPTQAGK